MLWKFKTVYLAYLLHLEEMQIRTSMIKIINSSFSVSNIYILFYELLLTSNIPYLSVYVH